MPRRLLRDSRSIGFDDRLLEIEHLAVDPEGEFLELVEIYVNRGLTRELAREEHARIAPGLHAMVRLSSSVTPGVAPEIVSAG